MRCCSVKIFVFFLFWLFVLLLPLPVNGNQKSFKLVIEGNINGVAYLYFRPQGSSDKYEKVKVFLPCVVNIVGMESREIYIKQHLYFFVIKKSDIKVVSLPQLYPVKLNCHYELDTFRIFSCCLIVSGLFYVNKKKWKLDIFSRFKKSKECIAGKYFIQDVIGEGGMATVYKALDNKGKIYALKIPHNFCLNNDVSYKRFVHEALIASRLIHPYITSVFDWSTEKESKPFICMEYVKGITLEELMKHDYLKDKIIDYAIKISEALSYAHSQNIVHRDIKPSNIIVTPDDNIKLTDFGIARAFDLTSVTASGAFVGTPVYMAPEQIDGKNVDVRVDLYSLGTILYEVYAGKKPFDDSDPMRSIMKKLANEAEDISNIVDISPQLSYIVMKLIKREPKDRFSSADELIKELKKV